MRRQFASSSRRVENRSCNSATEICRTHLVGAFVLASLIRLPIALSMFLAGAVYFIVTSQDLGLLADQVMGQMTGIYVLVAIPMFILAANVMNDSGISERLWGAADALVGRLRGGTGHVTVLVSIIFSSMTGSAVTEAAGPGVVAVKMMRKIGRYPIELAVAVTAAASVIAPVIPPSIPLVIYAMLSGASVGTLFLAGIVPGLLMALIIMTTIAVMARFYDLPTGTGARIGETMPRLGRAALPMTLPVVLLGGIWTGWFSPTESAAVAALWGMVLGILIMRTLQLRQLPGAFETSVRQMAATMLLIASAFVVNYAIANEGLGAALVRWISSMELTQLQFMLLVNAILLVLGCFLDGSVILLVVIPLLLPSVKALGIDLNYFGVVVVINFMIGLISPPYGLVLFVLSSLTGAPLQKVFVAILPFVASLIMLLLLLVIFPQIILFLPHMFGYY
ncbi:tripartite ATP-independent transporter DctM subunit [Pseudaminobacter salicylatoxidans]|uniref:TRAP transporter large permease protein n=1 Tax=Pseudaminobacter salicylatoxidans TaxID=93369 RepID=A0A316CBI2_PSESE|nr:tripartite ATP-independent transporter DctM subunit [Pseudaminobacter salicylatoxidans]